MKTLFNLKTKLVAAIVTLVFITGFSQAVFAQMGIGTSNPDSKTVLDITSADKGILLPRMASDPTGYQGTGIIYYNTASNQFKYYNGAAWVALGSGTGNGTVTNVSVVNANGFSGSVANPTTTPAITLTTTITGLLKGNGTAISAAVAGTDYLAPNASITGGTNTKITYDSKGLVTAGTAAALASSDFANQGSTTTLLHGNASGNPSWGQVNLASDVTGTLPAANGGTGGTLPVANGGTGQSTYTNGQLLIGNTTGSTLTKATLTGTTDQVIVTNGTGSITLSTPQNINTTSSPTFANLTDNGLSASSAVYTNGSKVLTSTAPTSGTIGYWGRSSTTLSPSTSGDAITTSGNISTTSSGTITSAGLLTGSAGATISGAATSINNNSNFATTVNTGTSTGAVSIANGTVGGNIIAIGNNVGATSITEKVGTGNYMLDGVAASNYTIGASTTSGTITIGGTAQTGDITIGSSSGTQAVKIGVGAGDASVTLSNPGIANRAGVHINNGRLSINKPTAPASYSANTTLTAAEIADAGIVVVTANNITLTLPTAANLVAVLPGTPTVGDIITFVIVNTSNASIVTLAAGTGGTLVGPAATAETRSSVNPNPYYPAPPRLVTIRFTNVGSGTEAYSIY
jgi:hypothetical protein